MSPPAGDRLWLTEEPGPGWLRLSLDGELDISTAGALRYRLERARESGCALRLNLSGLGFVDSSGLRVLLDAVRSFRASGLDFGVEPSLQPQVVRLLNLVHVHHMLIDADA